MIGILIWLLVFLVVVYIARLIIDALELPENIKKIVYLIFALIVLLALLNQLGFIASYPVMRF